MVKFSAYKENGGSQKGSNEGRYFSEGTQNDGQAYAHETSSFGPHAAGILDGEIEAYLDNLRETFGNMTSSGENEPSNGFSDPNDLDGDNPSPLTLLARNSLSELSSHMPEVSRHNLACRLVERLFQYAGAASCVKVLNTLLETGPRQFASLAVHPCASHLLQRCLSAAQDSEQLPSKLGTTITSWTKDMMCEVMASSSGSHVFRTAVSLFARVPDANEKPNSRLMDTGLPSARYFDDLPKKPTDADRKTIIAIALKLLEKTPDDKPEADEDSNQFSQSVVDDLHRLASRPVSCAALQALLTAIAVCDMEVVGKLTNAIIPKRAEDLLVLIEDRIASRLIDRIILVFSPDEPGFPGSIQSLMQDNDTFLQLVEHPSANFCVQQYISRLTNRGSIARVARVLVDPIENQLLSYGHGGRPRDGVVLSLLRTAEANADQKTQASIARAIARGVAAVDKDAPNLVGHLLLRGKAMWSEWCRRVDQLDVMMQQTKYPSMNSADNEQNNNTRKRLSLPRDLPRMSTVGALIARALMRLPEGPGQMARASMAALPPNILLAFCADNTGSRVVDQWILADSDLKRSEKVCTKVISALLGDPQKQDPTKPDFIETVRAVCRNPNAGSVLTQSTQRANTHIRRKVMDALSTVYESLKNDRFGMIVLRKCRVHKYMSRTDDWEQRESEHDTRKRLFADILDDGIPDEHDERQEEALKLSNDDQKHVGKKKKKRKSSADADSVVMDEGAGKTKKIKQEEVEEQPKKKKRKSKDGDEGARKKKIIEEEVKEPAKKKKRKPNDGDEGATIEKSSSAKKGRKDGKTVKSKSKSDVRKGDNDASAKKKKNRKPKKEEIPV